MGYTGQALMKRPRSLGIGEALRVPKRVVARGLGGPLTITVTHGGLGAAGESMSFEDGVQLASDALDREFDLASTLYDRATSPEIKSEAEHAMEFAASGFKGLTKAISNGDVSKVRSLQAQIDNVTRGLRADLVDATIDRFILAVIAPPLATADAETLDQLAEKIRTAKVPGGPDAPIDIPLWAYGAGGLAILAVLGYFIRAIK